MLNMPITLLFNRFYFHFTLGLDTTHTHTHTRAQVMMKSLNIGHRFELIILGDECTRPKPFPDPYLEGLKYLGAYITLSFCVTPSRRVFEDFPLKLSRISHPSSLLDYSLPSTTPNDIILSITGVSPDNAIAVEDSPSGLKAAVRAGIPTVGILSGHDGSVLQEAGSCLLVQDYHELMARLGIEAPVNV